MIGKTLEIFGSNEFQFCYLAHPRAVVNFYWRSPKSNSQLTSLIFYLFISSFSFFMRLMTYKKK